MNHFLLASDNLQRSNIHDSRAGYYGVYAMQIVINKMIKLGADKQRILCKVFGGGNVVAQLGSYDGESMTVGEQNIAFVFEYPDGKRYKTTLLFFMDCDGKRYKTIVLLLFIAMANAI